MMCVDIISLSFDVLTFKFTTKRKEGFSINYNSIISTFKFAANKQLGFYLVVLFFSLSEKTSSSNCLPHW